jgi:endonuclease V-like protein UPF0215 family
MNINHATSMRKAPGAGVVSARYFEVLQTQYDKLKLRSKTMTTATRLTNNQANPIRILLIDGATSAKHNVVDVV